MHKIIDDLKWRYAVKRFDSERRLSDEQVQVLKEALRLTPTSYGLQAMKLLWINSPELREQLKEASNGQTPITDASHLLVLCAYRTIQDQHVDQHVDRITLGRSLPVNTLQGYRDFLKQTLVPRSEVTITQWTSKQVYIALGILLHACASMRIDSLPMEGFDASRYDEILNLKEKNLTAVLVCPIGYRHADDPQQHFAKVRKPDEDLFEVL